MYSISGYGTLVYGDGYGFWDRQASNDSSSTTTELARITIPSTDAGTSVELATITFSTSVSDTGAGTELSHPNYRDNQAGTGTESFSEKAVLPTQTDSGVGTDLGSGNPAGHEFPVTIETVSVRVRITTAEDFIYVEDSKVVHKDSDANAAVNEDATLNTLFVSLDSGSGTEAIGARSAQIIATDVNAAPYEDTVVKTRISDYDYINVAEVPIVHAVIPSTADSGTGTQASTIKTKITANDTGFSGLVEGRSISHKATDAGSAVEGQSSKAKYTVGDVSWHCDDDESIVVKLPISADTGHGVDLRLNDAEITRTEVGVGVTANILTSDYSVDDEFHAVENLSRMKRTMSEDVYVQESANTRVRLSTADSQTVTDSGAVRVRWTRSDVGSSVQAQSMVSHISQAETIKVTEKQILARPIDLASAVKLVTGLTSAGHSLERVTP